jgi:hypothetical protein
MSLLRGNNVEKKEDYIIFKIDRDKELFSRIRTYFLIEHIEQRKDGQIQQHHQSVHVHLSILR